MYDFKSFVQIIKKINKILLTLFFIRCINDLTNDNGVAKLVVLRPFLFL